MKEIGRLCTKLIIVLSTVMMGLTGVLGINITRYCLFAVMGLSFVKILSVKAKIREFVMLVAVIAACFVHYLMGLALIINILIFVSTLLLCFSFHKSGIDKQDWKLIKACAYILNLIYLLLFIVAPNENYAGNVQLFFDNPNMTGIAVFAPTVILIVALFEKIKQRGIGRVINSLFVIADLVLIYMTNNRGSFVAALAILIFMIVKSFRRSEGRHRPIIQKILALLPIVIMFIYVGLLEILPMDVEFLGKPLFSGRETAWQIALGRIMRDPFAVLRFEEGTLNVFLECIARFGLMTAVLYFAYLFFLECPCKRTKSVQHLAYMAFFISLFQQGFESTLITGSYTAFVWTYILLGIGSMEDDPHSVDVR